MLFTSTSIPPKRPVAWEMRAPISSALVRSAARWSTSALVSSRISAAVRARASSSRLEITTLAPSRASSVAIALPRPLLAAVTSATLPSRPRSKPSSLLPRYSALPRSFRPSTTTNSTGVRGSGRLRRPCRCARISPPALAMKPSVKRPGLSATKKLKC